LFLLPVNQQAVSKVEMNCVWNGALSHVLKGFVGGINETGRFFGEPFNYWLYQYDHYIVAYTAIGSF
jgi:hypothetical protein